MYDDLYNLLDNYEYQYKEEDDEEELVEDEEEITEQEERLQQLKLDRLKLIRKAARKIATQKPLEAIVATPVVIPKATPSEVTKPYQKLPTAFNDTPIECLEESFIFSFLYNLSRIQPKRTLKLKKPLPTTEKFMKRMLGVTYEARHLIDPETIWSRNYEDQLKQYSKGIKINGKPHPLSYYGYYHDINSKGGLAKMYTLNNPEAFDTALLGLIKNKYEGIPERKGVIYKVITPRKEVKYLFSMKALRWFEAEMENKEFYHV